MSRHLGDTSCSIHTHNLHSSWDKVCTSTGVFLYSMNESTLLTKAVSALCLSQVYDGGGGDDVLLASYNDASGDDSLFRPEASDKNNRPGGLARRKA